MQYNYNKKMFTGRAKPIRIIGDPNNQRPDKRSSTFIIIIIIIIISLSPLFRVAIHILVFLRQTMSLGDTLLQLFSLCCLWCLYV